MTEEQPAEKRKSKYTNRGGHAPPGNKNHLKQRRESLELLGLKRVSKPRKPSQTYSTD